MYRLIAFKTMKRIIFSFLVVAAIAVSAVVVTSCGNAQAQGGSSAKAERWEYKIVDDGIRVSTQAENIRRGEEILNRLGEEGWELVSIANSSGSSATAFLKRRLP